MLSPTLCFNARLLLLTNEPRPCSLQHCASTNCPAHIILHPHLGRIGKWRYKAVNTGKKIVDTFGSWEGPHACSSSPQGPSTCPQLSELGSTIFASVSYHNADNGIVHCTTLPAGKDAICKCRFQELAKQTTCGWDGSHSKETVYMLTIAPHEEAEE